ncbi:MAG: hypothetical protein JST69_08170 [Bacteroidetes bacterium]|nr:hypothetical protein [Bacteroidota bacterium]
MENFELIEKYISGKMTDAEKLAFETQLNADPTLKSELTLQETIVSGIKKARAAELKTMLSQVPVGSMLSAGVATTKIVAGVIATTAVVTVSYFYFKPASPVASPTEVKTKILENKKTERPQPEVTITTTEPEKIVVPAAAASTPSVKPKNTKVSPAKATPKINVLDPTDELTTSPTAAGKTEIADHMTVAVSHIAVEINNSEKTYSFHYQFQNGRLILYGEFDATLYEILEIHGNGSHPLFLYYKNNYYLLDEKQTTVTPLSAIQNAQLVQKLKEYRSKQN